MVKSKLSSRSGSLEAFESWCHQVFKVYIELIHIKIPINTESLLVLIFYLLYVLTYASWQQ